MEEIILILTVGLPRSGKSTWAKTQGVPIVNPDAIRLALTGQAFRAESENFVWAIARCMVESLFGAGHTTVILDATNTTTARRDMWFSETWTRQYKVFDTPVDVCIQRAIDGKRMDLIPVIKRMQSLYEPVA